MNSNAIMLQLTSQCGAMVSVRALNIQGHCSVCPRCASTNADLKPSFSRQAALTGIIATVTVITRLVRSSSDHRWMVLV